MVKCAFSLLMVIVTQLPTFAQDFASTLSECQKNNLFTNGKPVVTRLSKHLALGVSLSQHEFEEGKPIRLHIWVLNSGNTSTGVFTCSDLDLFKSTGFQIFNQDGRRILSRDELRSREECSTENNAVLWGGPVPCARNIQLSIPAHTCTTRDNSDFVKTLTEFYDLPPGGYTLRIRADWKMTAVNLCSPENPERSQRRSGDLTFIVTKP